MDRLAMHSPHRSSLSVRCYLFLNFPFQFLDRDGEEEDIIPGLKQQLISGSCCCHSRVVGGSWLGWSNKGLAAWTAQWLLSMGKRTDSRKHLPIPFSVALWALRSQWEFWFLGRSHNRSNTVDDDDNGGAVQDEARIVVKVKAHAPIAIWMGS